jgi:PKD repeat protein
VTKNGAAYGAAGSDPSYTFTPNDNGEYVVTLVASDEDGGSTTVSKTIVVTNIAPQGATITGATGTSPEGTAITLGNSFADPGSADTHTHQWSVTKNGAVYGSSGAGAGYTFTPDDNGSYVVTLTVTDDDGGVGTATQTIAVTNVAPTAAITGVPAGGTEGTAITLGSTVSDPGTADSHTYSWSVTKGGSAYASGSGAGFSFTPDDNGTYLVTLTATDDDGGSDTETATIVAANVAPAASIASIGSVRREGSAIAVAGSATDPGTLDTLTYSWQVFKDGGATAFVAGSGSDWSFTPDDNGSYRVVLTATDKDGASHTVDQTITVDNVAPIAAVAGPTTGQQGVAFSLAGSATDPGPLDTAAGFTYAWAVTRGGDPVDLTGAATTGSMFAYTPTEPGAYTITLTVTDKDGGTSTVQHQVVVAAVAGATLLPGGRLVIVGTDGADKIMVNPGGGAPEIKVKVNGSDQTFIGVTEVVIYANGGDDDVKVAGGVALNAWLFGGDGHDRLMGGGGNNVVVGGAGNDLVAGGVGRDLLIGGAGADRLVGNEQDDVLIAGSTAFDANLSALGLILAEWTSGRTFAERVANLGGAVGGANTGVYLVGGSGADATVSDDGSEDVLTGNQGNDWFIVNNTVGTVRDKVTDWSAYEAQYVEDIEFITTFVG